MRTAPDTTIDAPASAGAGRPRRRRGVVVAVGAVAVGLALSAVPAGAEGSGGEYGGTSTVPGGPGSLPTTTAPPVTTTVPAATTTVLLGGGPGTTAEANPAAVSGPASGTLPFTGGDVAGMLVIGAALVGGGGLAVMAGRRARR
jgi:hypothetical protein